MFNGIIWIDREDYIIFIHCSSQNSFFITPHRSLNPSHPSPPSACSTRCASSPRRSSRPPQQCRWPGSSDHCCVPSCNAGGWNWWNPQGFLGRKIMGRENPEKTTGNMWKHLLSAMAMLVCWRCNPIHPMQIYGCQSKFENQQLAPKFSETMIINPSSLTHPLLGTLHKLPPEFSLLPSHCILSRSRFISSQVLQMFPCNLDRLKKRRTGHDRVYTTQHTLRYTKYYWYILILYLFLSYFLFCMIFCNLVTCRTPVDRNP